MLLVLIPLVEGASDGRSSWVKAMELRPMLSDLADSLGVGEKLASMTMSIEASGELFIEHSCYCRWPSSLGIRACCLFNQVL